MLLLNILTSHKTVINIKKDEGSIKTRLVAEINWNGENPTVVSAARQDPPPQPLSNPPHTESPVCPSHTPHPHCPSTP